MELRTKAGRSDAVTDRERENLQVAYRAAFAKTAALEPGKTEELELTFDLRELSSYRERDGAFILDSGDYVLRLGDSSRNTCPVAVLALEKETVVSWHAGICPVQEHMHLQELQAPARAREVLEPGLPRIVLDCAAAAPMWSSRSSIPRHRGSISGK